MQNGHNDSFQCKVNTVNAHSNVHIEFKHAFTVQYLSMWNRAGAYIARGALVSNGGSQHKSLSLILTNFIGTLKIPS